jgi:hypothetical protein
MRFLCIHRSPESNAPPSEKLMTEMGQLIEEMARAGVLIATEGCLPSALGARVRIVGDKLVVTDGPFPETKEIIGGFALIQVASKDEAVEWTERFLRVVGEGESEIRQVADVPAFESGQDAGRPEASVAR